MNQPNTKPQRRKKGLRYYLSTLLIVVGVVLLGAAAYLWGSAQWRYHEQDKVNRKLAQYVTIKEGTLDADGAPEDTGPKPPVVDWDGLKAINKEVCAWLQVPGTTINYPVYQTDNNEYYLRHSAETGEWTVGGQLFIDCECTWPGMADQVTLVYGHHLNDGSMFEQIAEMDQQDRFDQIETVWYVTEERDWELEPLFMYFVQPEDPDARMFKFETDEEFTTYLKAKLERAVTKRADAAEIVDKARHVLVLATCNYYDGYGRSLLICVPKAEANAVIPPKTAEPAADATDAPAESTDSNEVPTETDASDTADASDYDEVGSLGEDDEVLVLGDEEEW